MAILSDKDIITEINQNKLQIKPFNEINLTPNGYDLTIDEIYINKTNDHINKEQATIPPLTWFVISTKEYIEMGAEITAQLWIRTSYARKGILAAFGKVDAGFHGTLTISCFNANDKAIEIPVGDRFCQITFEKLSSSPSALYNKRSGNYQGQKGIRLKP